ncbi:MAG: WG repeat-containing protein [Alistipes sp.]|nr:WG repeat-containing protein [Alistipes sp.]
MRHKLLLFVVAWIVSSCSPLLYSSYLPIGDKVQLAGKSLTPTEDRATGLYGYLNDFGIWAIPPQFKYAGSFTDGMARVRQGSYYGVINPLGQWIVQPVFSSSLDCDGAIRSIRKGRMVGLEMWIAEDPATERYGYLNHLGKWQIEPQYENGYNFDDDGFAIVKVVGGGWGVIDRSNKWVIQPNFESSMDARSSLSRLKR